MEKYTGQNITHARNGGEPVFKLMNKRVYPDGYAEVPEKEYKAIKEDFITKTHLNVDEGLIDRNEKWKDMETKGHVTKKRIVYLFHGCIRHGYQDCEDGKLEHRGVSRFDRSRTIKLQEDAYKRAGFEVVRVWECEWKMKE